MELSAQEDPLVKDGHSAGGGLDLLSDECAVTALEVADELGHPQARALLLDAADDALTHPPD